MEELSGQVVIVTGAGCGIGRAVVAELAEAGARLVLVARTKADLARAAEEVGEERAALVAGDVTDEATAAAAVARAQEWGGRLDAVVNNAGIGWSGATHEMPVDAWRRLIDVNLTGVFLFTRAARHAGSAKRAHHQHRFWGGAPGNGAGRRVFRIKVWADWLHRGRRTRGAWERREGERGRARVGSDGFSASAAQRDWALRSDDVARVVRAVLATGPNVWIREAFVTPLQIPPKS